jgi:hypothetical protein
MSLPPATVEECLPEELYADTRAADTVAVPPGAPAMLPTLFGAGGGQSESKPLNFIASVAIHAFVIVALLLLGRVVVKVVPEANLGTVAQLVAPMRPHTGGGGGGKHDLLPASSGTLPTRSLKPQIAPPEVITRNDHPRLTAQQTIEARATSVWELEA